MSVKFSRSTIFLFVLFLIVAVSILSIGWYILYFTDGSLGSVIIGSLFVTSSIGFLFFLAVLAFIAVSYGAVSSSGKSRKAVSSSSRETSPPRDIPVFASLAIIVALILVVNFGLEKWAEYLVSGDHDDLDAPVSAKVFALRREKERCARGYWQKEPVSCHGLCLHALLSGKAKRVLIVEAEGLDETPSPNERGVAFQIEPGDECPDVELARACNEAEVSLRGGRYAASIVEAMKIRMMNGECLVSRSATLNEADVVMTIEKKKERAGLKVWLGGVSRDRIMIHLQNDDDVAYREVYRWTGVEYYPISLLPFPFFPSFREYRINYPGRRPKIEYIIKDHYEKLFGIDFSLDADEIEKKIVEKMNRILGEGRSPSNLEWQVFSGYYKSLLGTSGSGRCEVLVPRDVDLALRVLKSPAFPPPVYIDRVVECLRKRKNMNYSEKMKEFAYFILKKMDAGVTWDKGLPYAYNPYSILLAALREVPEDILKQHADLLFQVLENREVRIRANKIIGMAGFLGEKLVPVLVDSVDEGIRFRERRNFWAGSKLHKAALMGMCIIGEKAKSASGHMLALLKAGKLPLSTPSRDAGDIRIGHGLIITLLRMGVKPEEIEAHFPAEKVEEGRKYLDYVMRDWRRGKTDASICDKYI